jgi:hypothetical protein
MAISGGTEEVWAMSVILSLAIVCAAATQGDAALKSAGTGVSKSAGTAAKKASAPARVGRELEKAAHAALRRWAQSASKDLQPAGREYLALYKDLQRDTVLAKSTRKELLGKLRYRLAALAKKMRKQLAAGKVAGADKRQAADGDAQPDSIDPGRLGAPLGQQAGGAGGAGGGAGSRTARDAGWDLVDLIESTISPSTWARNGGNGDIYYWRPGMALVVAAPQGVQEDVGGLIDQVH